MESMKKDGSAVAENILFDEAWYAHYSNLEEQWHGFEVSARDYAMLDPIKVIILTPGGAPDKTPGIGCSRPHSFKISHGQGCSSRKNRLLLFPVFILNWCDQRQVGHSSDRAV